MNTKSFVFLKFYLKAKSVKSKHFEGEPCRAEMGKGRPKAPLASFKWLQITSIPRLSWKTRSIYISSYLDYLTALLCVIALPRFYREGTTSQ